jgi:hypothetical protein
MNMMSDNFPVLSNEYAKFLRRILQTMDADEYRRKGYIVATLPEYYTLPLIKPRGKKHKYAIRTHIGQYESIDEFADNPSEVYDKFTSIPVSTSISNTVDPNRYFKYIFMGYFYPSNECIITEINDNVLVKPKPFYEDIPHIRIHNIKHQHFDIILNEDEFYFE